MSLFPHLTSRDCNELLSRDWRWRAIKSFISAWFPASRELPRSWLLWAFANLNVAHEKSAMYDHSFLRIFSSSQLPSTSLGQAFHAAKQIFWFLNRSIFRTCLGADRGNQPESLMSWHFGEIDETGSEEVSWGTVSLLWQVIWIVVGQNHRPFLPPRNHFGYIVEDFLFAVAKGVVVQEPVHNLLKAQSGRAWILTTVYRRVFGCRDQGFSRINAFPAMSRWSLDERCRQNQKDWKSRFLI